MSVQIGDRFGFLTVTGFGPRRTSDMPGGRQGGRRNIYCVCDCGKEAFPNEANLIAGRTRSCGCKRWRGKGKSAYEHRVEELRRVPTSRRRALANITSEEDGVVVRMDCEDCPDKVLQAIARREANVIAAIDEAVR